MQFWAAVAWVDPAQLLEVARACDDHGYEGVLVSDHIFYPRKLTSAYPYSPTGAPLWPSSAPWPDPWVLIGAMAAATRRLRFSTNIYIAAARHPMVVAKAVATAAVLSDNRVALGVGAGWMKEEFDLLGTDFTNRGKRLDEMIEVLRALWRGGMVEHHGNAYDFDALEISPVPSEPVPIYAGGHSDAALRRAARLDGWIGNSYPVEEAIAYVERLQSIRSQAGTGGAYEIILGVMARPDAELCRRLEDVGVTGLICAPWMTGKPDADAAGRLASVDAKRDAIARFAEQVIARAG
jgi:probable F420-dependent oxidoreductase